MKRTITIIVVLLTVCGMLGGCDFWMSGDYLSVRPNEGQLEQTSDMVIAISSYNQLREVLDIQVASCAESVIVSVSSFNDATVDFYVQTAIDYIMDDTPVGAYGVDRIDYEIGTNRGEPVVVFKIYYRYPSADILSIRKVRDSEDVFNAALTALGKKESYLVLKVDELSDSEIEGRIESHILTHGDQIVEIPEYRLSLYPNNGDDRIVEMVFAYENDKKTLDENQKRMEQAFIQAEESNKNVTQVLDIFRGYYSFLVNNCTYAEIAGNMPVYSLMCEGRGDSKAFAMTFAALCRRAELDCNVVSGTYNGEQRFWNLVRFRGTYYHLDILECINSGEFSIKTASEMSGYQWDMNKYPSGK